MNLQCLCGACVDGKNLISNHWRYRLDQTVFEKKNFPVHVHLNFLLEVIYNKVTDDPFYLDFLTRDAN